MALSRDEIEARLSTAEMAPAVPPYDAAARAAHMEAIWKDAYERYPNVYGPMLLKRGATYGWFVNGEDR